MLRPNFVRIGLRLLGVESALPTRARAAIAAASGLVLVGFMLYARSTGLDDDPAHLRGALIVAGVLLAAGIARVLTYREGERA